MVEQISSGCSLTFQGCPNLSIEGRPPAGFSETLPYLLLIIDRVDLPRSTRWLVGSYTQIVVVVQLWAVAKSVLNKTKRFESGLGGPDYFFFP